jgi:hypothetical protein
MGRRTLTPGEVADLHRARDLRMRTLAAAQIATVAMDQPEPTSTDLMRLAARLIPTTSADWMPRATAIEVASWDDWEQAG